jgi:fermentation-respiration switch protein FrsA (DUF1100 family)
MDIDPEQRPQGAENRRLNPLWHLLWVLPLLYGALATWIYFMQERMLFLPDIAGRELVADPSAVGLAFEEKRIATPDGESLHAWWIPAERPRLSLLFLHGNAGNISHRLDSLRLFHRLGVDVLIIDYRGYGRSSGRPTEQGVLTDAQAAWRHMVESMGLAPDRIVLFGRSLGGAAAAWLASRQEPAGLILESTFTSVPDAAADVYWWLPVRRLSRLELDTRKWLSQVRSPVLIIHSRDDEIIPFTHARRLYEAAAGDKQLVAIEGDHNTGFVRSGRRYTGALDDFLTRVAAGR